MFVLVLFIFNQNIVSYLGEKLSQLLTETQPIAFFLHLLTFILLRFLFLLRFSLDISRQS
jgi:hypothetical protein